MKVHSNGDENLRCKMGIVEWVINSVRLIAAARMDASIGSEHILSMVTVLCMFM